MGFLTWHNVMELNQLHFDTHCCLFDSSINLEFVNRYCNMASITGRKPESWIRWKYLEICQTGETQNKAAPDESPVNIVE